MAEDSTTINENGDVQLQHAYVMRSQIADVVTTNKDKWKQTPKRAEDMRELLNGDKLAPIPDGFKIAGADNFRVDAPAKYLTTYHQRNTLAKDVPRVKRWHRGESDKRKLESTRIEQIVQAVMDDRYKFEDSVDILLIESVCLSISMPNTASMSQVPSIYDRDGKTIKERYQRNAQGKERPTDKKSDEYKTWRLSKKAAAKAHAEDKRYAQSRNIPLDNELIGPTGFIPVFGPGLVLDAAVVERYWTQNDLIKRKLVWDGMQAQMSPDGTASDSTSIASTSGGRIKVTELHAVDYQEDEDGEIGCHSYIAYMVDGGEGKGRVPLKKRGKNGEEVDAIICLRCDYGLKQPHFVLEWGQQWAHPEYDKRGMPFPLPFAQSWLAIDAILTGATVWAWWRGFPTLIEQPSANTPPEIDIHTDSPDDDDDDILEIAPMSIIRAKGNVTELGTQGPNNIVMQLVSYMDGANEQQGPPGSAFGGDAASGFAASLSRSYADDAMSDIRKSTLKLYKRTASVMFELLCGIAEKFGGSVPIERLTPVPLGSRSKDGGRKREILDVTPDLAGEIFDIDADWPPRPDLARGQQLAEWSERGLVLRSEFREQVMGDEHPEIFEARLLKQQMQDSPENRMKVWEIVAQLEGNEAERQRIMALASGQGEQGTDGVVRPAAVPGAPPTGDPGALTGGGGMPMIADAALGGAIGGPTGAATRAAAAGGTVPADIQMGPVVG